VKAKEHPMTANAMMRDMRTEAELKKLAKKA
jgi:hypothetical protein